MSAQDTPRGGYGLHHLVESGAVTVDWVRQWLPAVDPAADDRERARRLRAGLEQLDQWTVAIGVLREEWAGRLANLEADEDGTT